MKLNFIDRSFLDYVLSTNMEDAGFTTYTAASHQGETFGDLSFIFMNNL